MNITFKSILLSALAVGLLSLSAVADPVNPETNPNSNAQVENASEAITEVLQLRQTPARPLMGQQDVATQQLQVQEGPERPHGRSRIEPTRPGTFEKPLLEIHGF
jgi:hypothetical protein